jgi:hypothetical protein
MALAPALVVLGCATSASDFEAFMRTTLPSNVTVLKMDGNWGADPWRCWEIAPASDELKRKLISTWNLVPDSHAFHGVASGNHIYCRYDGLSESYSGDADSYRAVGIDATKNIMVVYFYNG